MICLKSQYNLVNPCKTHGTFLPPLLKSSKLHLSLTTYIYTFKKLTSSKHCTFYVVQRIKSWNVAEFSLLSFLAPLKRRQTPIDLFFFLFWSLLNEFYIQDGYIILYLLFLVQLYQTNYPSHNHNWTRIKILKLRKDKKKMVDWDMSGRWQRWNQSLHWLVHCQF